jgi:flagellar biosynthesis anti-sigma factor FlgM
MRIYDQSLTNTAAAESGRSQETQKAASTPLAGAGGGGSGDRVELSSALTSVSRALTAYHTDRTAKVQALTEQFQSGSYQPDSQAIGQAMVAQALGAGAK